MRTPHIRRYGNINLLPCVILFLKRKTSIKIILTCDLTCIYTIINCNKTLTLVLSIKFSDLLCSVYPRLAEICGGWMLYKSTGRQAYIHRIIVISKYCICEWMFGGSLKSYLVYCQMPFVSVPQWNCLHMWLTTTTCMNVVWMTKCKN